jgi:hypothetical protein
MTIGITKTESLIKHGYAPGEYMFWCKTCGAKDIGDKTSKCCRKCATFAHISGQYALREHQESHVKIFEFKNAPQELKLLSCNGGDEDWIAILPNDFNDGFRPFWLEEGTSFGCCCVDEYEHPNYPNCKILIGCHS